MNKIAVFMLAMIVSNSSAFAEPPDVKIEAQATGTILPDSVEGATDSEYLPGEAGDEETLPQYDDDYNSAVEDTIESRDARAAKAAEDAYVEAGVEAASGVDTKILPIKIIEDSVPANASYPVCTEFRKDQCTNPDSMKEAM